MPSSARLLPTTFFIGRNGAIVDKLTGLLDRKDIENDVQKALATNPSTPPKPVATSVQLDQAQMQSRAIAPDTRDRSR